jgi:hypothetical protein
MKPLTKKTKAGTGERFVRTPEDERIALNNVPIRYQEAQAFAAWYCDAYSRPKLRNLTFSKRRTKRRWGTTWPTEGRIILYRHAVWIFLHELAHITVNDPHAHHNKAFARELETVHDAWIRWKRRRKFWAIY